MPIRCELTTRLCAWTVPALLGLASACSDDGLTVLSGPVPDAGQRPERPIEAYELVAWHSDGCERETIPAGLRLRPLNATSINCLTADACSAPGRVQCAASTAYFCHYPGSERRCESDAECKALSNGRCANQTEQRCPNGNDCEEIGRFCSYPALESQCSTDSQCKAAPEGRCERMITNAGCKQDDCWLDSDCAPGSLCVCDDTRKKICQAANCVSDDDCPEGRRCARTLWLHDRANVAFDDRRAGHSCNGEGEHHYCTTPADACTSGTCGDRAACGYDLPSERFVCIACDWMVP